MLASWVTPPPLPPWEGLHPLVVHFPVALLLVAPLLVLLGLLPRVGRGFSRAALVVLILGTTAAYVAVESGEAAAEIATRTPEMAPVLAAHQELADAVRLTFTIVTLVYALVLLAPAIVKKTLKKPLPAGVSLVGQLVVLVALLLGGLLVANTGHLGGRLVHQFGVHAWLGDTGAERAAHE